MSQDMLPHAVIEAKEAMEGAEELSEGAGNSELLIDFAESFNTTPKSPSCKHYFAFRANIISSDKIVNKGFHSSLFGTQVPGVNLDITNPSVNRRMFSSSCMLMYVTLCFLSPSVSSTCSICGRGFNYIQRGQSTGRRDIWQGI